MVPGLRPYEVPVFLNYHSQPYYTKLQRAVINTLQRECSRHYESCRTNGFAVAGDAPDASAAAIPEKRSKRG